MSITFGLICIAFAIYLEWLEGITMESEGRRDDDR